MPPRGVHSTARPRGGLLLTAALCAAAAGVALGAAPAVPPRPRSNHAGHAQAGKAALDSLDLEELWCRYGLAGCSDANMRAVAAAAAGGGQPAGLPPLTVERMPARAAAEEAASEETLAALIDAAFGRALARAAAQQPAARLGARLADSPAPAVDAAPSAGDAAGVSRQPARLLHSLTDAGIVAAGAAAAAGTAAGPATGLAVTALDAALSALDLVASSPQLALLLFVGKLVVSALVLLLWRRQRRSAPHHAAEQAPALGVLVAAPAVAAAVAATAASTTVPAAATAGMLVAEPPPTLAAAAATPAAAAQLSAPASASATPAHATPAGPSPAALSPAAAPVGGASPPGVAPAAAVSAGVAPDGAPPAAAPAAASAPAASTHGAPPAGALAADASAAQATPADSAVPPASTASPAALEVAAAAADEAPDSSGAAATAAAAAVAETATSATAPAHVDAALAAEAASPPVPAPAPVPAPPLQQPAGELKLHQLFGGAQRQGLLVRLGSGAADLDSTGSPRSPGGGAPSPLELGIDPSVRGRNAALKGWVETPAQRAPYRNPLFSSPDGQLATVGGGQQLPSPSDLPSDEEGGEEAAAGEAGAAGGAGWKAKQQAAAAAAGARGQSQDAEESFKLLAAELPPPSSTLAAPQAAPSGGASSRRASADLPSPSGPHRAADSPCKQAGGAARKLTAAHSVGPQDLSELEGVEGAAGEGAAHGSAAPPQAQRPSAAGGLPSQPAAAGSPRLTQLQLLRSPTAGGVPRSHSLGSPTQGGSCRVRLLTPQQLQDEVRLGRLLGVGASGCVYEAAWGGQRVAVKLLHPSTGDEKALAREVEAMAAVARCPFVVRVLGACLEPPQLALIQELAATSLHEELHKKRRRPLYGTLLQLAEDVAMALDHCHSQRPPLVHRDLSAKNVLLGLDGRARLADFGLAAARRRSFLSADKAGALGTPAYMAPEAMQAGPISERCDVYSYAILLWEMLTGREAWSELASPMQVVYAVGVERRRPPIPPGCPPALANLIRECWRHNGPLRPSFQEVLARLRMMRSQDSYRATKLGPSRADTPTDAGSPTASLASTRSASPAGARRAKTALFTPGGERAGIGSMRA